MYAVRSCVKPQNLLQRWTRYQRYNSIYNDNKDINPSNLNIKNYEIINNTEILKSNSEPFNNMKILNPYWGTSSVFYPRNYNNIDIKYTDVVNGTYTMGTNLLLAGSYTAAYHSPFLLGQQFIPAICLSVIGFAACRKISLILKSISY